MLLSLFVCSSPLFRPEYAHDSDKSDNLASLAYDLYVLELIEKDGQVEGDDGAEVDEIHGLLEETPLLGGTDEPNKVFKGEEDDDVRVDVIEHNHNASVLRFALVQGLELLHGRDDKGKS